MKKKILFILAILLFFVPQVSAQKIAKDDVSPSTYIIGKYMFTRNVSANYDGKLTTRRIMLSSKSLSGDEEEDMIIYYKKANGAWIDALTNANITVPSEFDIEVIDINGSAISQGDANGTADYTNDLIGSSTYVIGKYMFTRNQNDVYDGVLTTKRIMLAARTIVGVTESDMIIYYKKANGSWIDALANSAVALPDNFSLTTIDLKDIAEQGQASSDTTAPTISDITGGDTAKASAQTLTLKCSDNIGVTAYYFGTTEPSSASAITTLDELSSVRKGINKEVTATGTYWFACKDENNNYAKKSVKIVSYKAQSVLEKIAGTTGTYTSANYENSGSATTYIIKSGAELSLSTMFAVPTGASAETLAGYTTSALGSTNATLSNSNVTINDNSTYYAIYNHSTYTVTATGATNGSIKVESTNNSSTNITVGANETRTMAVKYGDTVKGTATPATGFKFGGWTGGYLTGTTSPMTGAAIKANITIGGSFGDTTAPTVNDIAGGTDLKATKLQVTLTCSDDSGLAAYYFGTTEPGADAITTTTEGDLAALSSNGLTKEVTAAGTYWFACKDSGGNFAKKSIKIVSYSVQNVLEKLNGKAGTYTTSNYENNGNSTTYFVKSGTKITMASITTAPEGSTYKGYVTSALGSSSKIGRAHV